MAWMEAVKEVMKVAPMWFLSGMNELLISQIPDVRLCCLEKEKILK